MSVEDKLHRLVIARDNIRTALEGQGIDASNHGFEGFAEDIGDIEKLSDVDVVAFGNNPTLPDEGKTNPANYEAIADAINAARARPSAVTLEPLTVAENGTYTAPSGKAYSPVTVAVPTETKLTTTYTAAEKSSSAVIPMPSMQYPKRIEIRTQTQGTALEDFSLGEVINFFAIPDKNNEYVNLANCCSAYRNFESGYRSSPGIVQVYSDTLYSTNTYSLWNGNLNIKMQKNGFFLPGVTYTADWYY